MRDFIKTVFVFCAALCLISISPVRADDSAADKKLTNTINSDVQQTQDAAATKTADTQTGDIQNQKEPAASAKKPSTQVAEEKSSSEPLKIEKQERSKLTELDKHPVGVVTRGGGGLFHIKSAKQPAHGLTHFLLTNRVEYYKGFDIGGIELDRLMFTSSLTWSPCPYTEFYAAFNGLSNIESSNTKSITQIGNTYFGLKLGYGVTRVFYIGFDFEGEYLAPVGDLNVDNRPFSYTPSLLATFDFANAYEDVPVRLHASVGYKFDSDNELAPSSVPTGLNTRYIATLLDIIGYNRIQAGLGLEFLFDYGEFIFEYNTMQVLEDIPYSFADQTNFLTAGVKLRPLSNKAISFDMAADIGISTDNPETKYGTAPPWNVLFGVTIASFGGEGAAKKEEQVGSVTGNVFDIDTGSPIAGAEISVVGRDDLPILLTREDGGFVTHPLPVGDVQLSVAAKGYVTQVVPAVVQSGGGIPIAVQLKKKPPEKGRLLVKFKDGQGKMLSGELKFVDYPEVGPFKISGEKGGLILKLKPGQYTLKAIVKGYDPETATFEVKSGEQSEAVFTLRRSGKVEQKGKKIKIKEKILFKSGKAEIEPSSMLILREIADFLKDHKEIKKVRIEGYTDSVGSAALNKRISQKRAEAVRRALISMGVEQERLEAVGFGEANPIAPNSTPAGRALNRRVEFKIVK